MKQTSPITAVVIAKNESKMIRECIQCLRWCSQILIIDTGSTDDTAQIAEQEQAQVIHYAHQSFAKVRNEALKHADQPWIMYIDADERVTPALAKEIAVGIETAAAEVFSFSRQNIFFGQEFKHGGWQKDLVTRVFKKSALQKWTGQIHESPQFTGSSKTLHSPLIHFSHRTVAEGLLKSASWTQLEAQQYVAAGFQAVTTWTVVRKMLGELYRRLLLQKGYADGQAGVFEAIIQACNKAFVFIQVWELQQNPPISDLYAAEESKIKQLWQQAE